MIDFIKDFSPMVLDTIIVSIFVLIIFFGVIKGIKNTLLDFAILLSSIFLGFTSYTNSIKTIFSKILNINHLVPAGSKTAYKIGVGLFSNCILSICVCVVFYIFMHLIKLLIEIIVKKRKKAPLKPKSKVGRVFSGIISLMYQGLLFIVMLVLFDTPFIGFDKSINKTIITDFLVSNSKKVLNGKDNKFTKKMSLKVIKGDVLYEVDNVVLENYEYFENKVDIIFTDHSYMEDISNDKFTKEETSLLIKERIYDMNKLVFFVSRIDDFEVCNAGLLTLVEEWLTIMNRAVFNKNMELVEMSINDYASIRLNLLEIGASNEVIALYDGVVVGK